MEIRKRRRAALLVPALAAALAFPASPGAGTPAQEAGNEASSSPSPGPAAQPPVAPKHPAAQCLQDSTNYIRTSYGLHTLPEAPVLLEIAQKHSDAMAADGWLRHSTDWVFGLLPPGWRAYGENVVYGRSCEQMFEAFMGSDSHRAAILRPDFNFSGTAVAHGSDGWIYTTLVFAALPEDAPAPPLPAPAGAVSPPPASPAIAPVPEAPAPAPLPAPPAGAPVISEPTISLGPVPSVRAGTGPAGAELLEGTEPDSMSSLPAEPNAEGGPKEATGPAEDERAALFDLERDAGPPASRGLQMAFELDGLSQDPRPRPSGMA